MEAPALGFWATVAQALPQAPDLSQNTGVIWDQMRYSGAVEVVRLVLC